VVSGRITHGCLFNLAERSDAGSDRTVMAELCGCCRDIRLVVMPERSRTPGREHLLTDQE